MSVTLQYLVTGLIAHLIQADAVSLSQNLAGMMRLYQFKEKVRLLPICHNFLMIRACVSLFFFQQNNAIYVLGKPEEMYAFVHQPAICQLSSPLE